MKTGRGQVAVKGVIHRVPVPLIHRGWLSNREEVLIFLSYLTTIQTLCAKTLFYLYASHFFYYTPHNNLSKADMV